MQLNLLMQQLSYYTIPHPYTSLFYWKLRKSNDSNLKIPKKSNRGGGGTPIETVVQSSCSSASYRDVHTMPTSQLASYRDMHSRPSAFAAQKSTVRANPTAHHWKIHLHTGEKSNGTVYTQVNCFLSAHNMMLGELDQEVVKWLSSSNLQLTSPW